MINNQVACLEDNLLSLFADGLIIHLHIFWTKTKTVSLLVVHHWWY